VTTQSSTGSPLDAHSAPVRSTDKRSGRAIAALIIGIISIVTAFVIPLVAWITGVVAIVLGANARADVKRNNCLGGGQATAAIVCGAVGIVAGIAIVAIVATSR
jgi:hypothetical protein